MIFLIYEPAISGHHLEYISHMINYALSCNTEDKFYFILNEKFERILTDQILVNEKVIIEYISDNYSVIMSKANVLIRSYQLSRCLKKYINIYNPDKIIITLLPSLIPFLPLFKFKTNFYRGILFKAPVVTNNNLSLSKKDVLLYRYIYQLKCFDKIWIVNNSATVNLLNEKYSTNLFSSLPDPINIISTLNNKIIDKYKNSDKIVLFHGGAMGKSKGTLDFIDALKLLPKSKHSEYIILFGGKVNNIEERQYLLDFINEYPSYYIVYNDKFISFEDLCSYISVSDYVMIPYKRAEQSSGILGYSALYNVPVIGPKNGLLGKLIKDNELGITITDTDPESIADTIVNLKKIDKDRENAKSQKYVSDNSIVNFVSTIFSKE